MSPPRRRNVQIEVACPVCHGERAVSVPADHDGTTERGHLSPAGERRRTIACGCDAGRATLLVDVQVLEDAIDDALKPAIAHALRGCYASDRAYLTDDISTLHEARDILAGLEITITRRAK